MNFKANCDLVWYIWSSTGENMFGLFELDFKKLLLVSLILALPLISLNLERRDSGQVKWYDQPVLWIVNPTQEFFSRFALGVSHTTGLYLNLLEIKKDNRLLKDEIEKQKQSLATAEDLRLENERLKKQLGFQQEIPGHLLGAQVVGVDLWPEYSSLKINKGANDAIKKGMTVITHDGVVGYILNTAANYSTVIVLTDHNAVIDAIVERTRARGIVEGLGADLCHIKYLQRTDDVQVGDMVVTSGVVHSGVDKVFPKGIPIGTITKVSKKAFGVTQEVELRPVVDTTRIEEVMIVIPNEKDLEKVILETPTKDGS
jgi:rod shape-determining protein MreC